MTQVRTALVLGATGGIGFEVAAALAARGWAVRALHRTPDKARAAAPGYAWMPGDAMDAESVAAAARGCAVIVHAVNPPGYRNWRGLALPMLRNTIGAAQATGATILMPGNVYNYGPDAFPTLREDSPQNPRTRKGLVRKEMEQMLATAGMMGVRSVVVRAGDFFGPRKGQNWFAKGLVQAGKPLTGVRYPGRAKAGHAWAYLPDLAETMVRLVERAESFPPHETFHFRGHVFEPGVAIVDAIRQASGRPNLKLRHFPWPLAYLAAPFVTFMREMLEMRYLWEETVLLDNRKLVGVLGEEPHTPTLEAVRRTLAGLGCLDAPAGATASAAPPHQIAAG